MALDSRGINLAASLSATREPSWIASLPSSKPFAATSARIQSGFAAMDSCSSVPSTAASCSSAAYTSSASVIISSCPPSC